MTSALRALLGGGVDVLHLAVGRALGRADLLVGAAELVDRHLATGVGGLEVRVAQVLQDERHGRAVATTAAPAAARRGVVVAAASGQGQAGDQRRGRQAREASVLRTSCSCLDSSGWRCRNHASDRLPALSWCRAAEVRAPLLASMT